MTSLQDQTDAARLTDQASYREPRLECDVVMKGGITSGVLYPLAACELATSYRLRSVGGTSAGAIAAAAAAAAEFGRSSDLDGAGFAGLATLPKWLSEDGNLIGLFRPTAESVPLHRILLAAVTKQGAGKVVGILAALAGYSLRTRGFWIPIAASVPGLTALATLLTGSVNAVLGTIAGLLAVLLTGLGFIVGATLAVVLEGGRVLSSNMYGLVTGSNSFDGRDSLSDWLADYLDVLAGRDPAGEPLVFADLWEGPDGRRSRSPVDDPAINLEMQTTCLTEGRPYRLPDDLGGSFAFRESEFRRLFPDRVVDYLLQATDPDDDLPDGLHRLPVPALLPVVIATRISLSFPVLMSAVPLYAVDHSMGDDARYEPVWFSDGGITSNFPVSFFDRLLPSRPTFGINLRPFHPQHPPSEDQCRNVFLPRNNRSGVLEWWTRWSAAGLEGLLGFLRAIADTMQNWVDNDQLRVPGYRDRIVHISHTDKEGGMNLAMPPEILGDLAKRGLCAGQRLVEFYTTPPDGPEVPEPDRRIVSWENHRRIRLRTSLALAKETITAMAAEYERGRYQADLDRDPPVSYPFTNRDQRALAQAFMEGASEDDPPRVSLPSGLRRLADAIEEVEQRGANVPLEVDAPRPAPSLRMAPGAKAPRQPIPERAGRP